MVVVVGDFASSMLHPNNIDNFKNLEYTAMSELNATIRKFCIMHLRHTRFEVITDMWIILVNESWELIPINHSLVEID